MHTLLRSDNGPTPGQRRTLLLLLLASLILWPTLGAPDRFAAFLGPLCSTSADAVASGRPRSTNVTVSSEAPSHLPGKRVTVLRVTYPPGGHTPPHRHAGSVTAYILSGAVRSQLDYGPIGIFHPGETFFEAPGVIHSISENASQTEPAELLAVFVHDEGATLTTFLD